MFTLNIDVQDAEIRRLINRSIKELGDLSKPMSTVGQGIENRVSIRFETESDPDGFPWSPWADSTKKHYPYPGTPASKKSGKAGTGRILDRYGDMLNSLNHQSDSDSARIGFGVDYATYHEFGTKKMPRRGLLTSNPETGELAEGDVQYVLDVFDAFLSDMLYN